MPRIDNPRSASEIHTDGSGASKDHRSKVYAPRRMRAPPVFLFLPVSVAALGVSLLLLNTRMPRQSFRSLVQHQVMHDHHEYYGLLKSESNRTETNAPPDTNNDGKESGKSALLTASKPNVNAADVILKMPDNNHGGLENGTNVSNSHDGGDLSNGIYRDAWNHSSDGSNARLKNIIESSTGSFESNGTLATTLEAHKPYRWRWPNATTDDSGNLVIEFFDRDRQRNEGMAACLINLEDTIRMAEWLPYHYATLPLGGLVIALDPKNSERGIQRTLRLIDLWRDKIDITLWPDFFIPAEKRYKLNQAYTRERQVYFANRCLMYHKKQNRTWTLLTDNDEYVVFNYVHDDETLEYDHPGAGKREVKKKIKKNRKKYMPLRKDLPPQKQSTILDYIEYQQEKMRNNSTAQNTTGSSTANDTQKESTKRFLPKCVRLPGIRYGGDHGLNETFGGVGGGEEIIERRFLTTLRQIHYEKRSSKFSKVMIDVSNVTTSDLKWKEAYKGNTIHNPSMKICGKNGKMETGADYPSSLFRLNHYLGSLESYLERSGDYRGRGVEKYEDKAKKIRLPNHDDNNNNKTTTTTIPRMDTDIVSWIEVFVRSVGGTAEARRLLEPLVDYQQQKQKQQQQDDGGAAAASAP